MFLLLRPTNDSKLSLQKYIFFYLGVPAFLSHMPAHAVGLSAQISRFYLALYCFLKSNFISTFFILSSKSSAHNRFYPSRTHTHTLPQSHYVYQECMKFDKNSCSSTIFQLSHFMPKLEKVFFVSVELILCFVFHQYLFIL